jgi:hypothetical protein
MLFFKNKVLPLWCQNKISQITMRTKKQTLRRITLLYVVFFVVIAISLVLTFNTSAFSEGFNTGYNDANRIMRGGPAGDKVQIVYDLSGRASDMDFDIPVYSSEDGALSINARPSKIDIEAVSKEGEGLTGMSYTTIFIALGAITYAAIFVVIFLILRSLRRSIRTEEMFDRANIARTRLTGILLIGGSLLMSLASWLDSRAVASYFEGSGLAINTAFAFNFTELIIGVLIFVIAEVFAIGYSISQEQKLTI